MLPLLGRVWIELPGARAWQEIEAATRKEMRRLEIGDLNVETAAPYYTEQAIRVLAIAVRDPDAHEVAFGNLEEWGELDNDVISVAWHAFGDIRERLDPNHAELTADDVLAIELAVKKKDPALLRSFGVAKLSAWLASTVDPRSTSPTKSSPSGASPSDSSPPPTQTMTSTAPPGTSDSDAE